MRRNPVRQFCFVLLVMLPASRALPQTAGGGPDAGKQEAFAWVDENRRELWRLNRFIWANPEVGLEEYQASDALIEQLEANGFTVQRGVADMPTAFVASYGAGEPVIAILAEATATSFFPTSRCHASSSATSSWSERRNSARRRSASPARPRRRFCQSAHLSSTRGSRTASSPFPTSSSRPGPRPTSAT